MDYSQLDEISLEAERWKIKELGLDLCSTIEDPDASTVNLVRACTCTEPGDEASAKLRYIKPTPGEVLWFPPEYNEDDKTTRDKISILINDALLRQKCIVSIQGHKRKNHKRDDGATRSIIFRCFRGVTKRKSVSENQRACTSKRPPEGVEPCKFQIRVTCTTTDRHNPRTYRYFIRLTAEVYVLRDGNALMLPHPTCVLVKRDHDLSMQILSEDNEVIQAWRMRKQEQRMEEGLPQPFHLEGVEPVRGVATMEEYTAGVRDIAFRFLSDIPGNPHTDRYQDKKGEADKNGNRTECNVCGFFVKWPHVAGDHSLKNSYGEHFGQFNFTGGTPSRQVLTGRLSTYTENLYDHCNRSNLGFHRFGEQHRIIHAFCLKDFPAKTNCWPWELLVVDVAQELLWEAFKETGGIPRELCNDALEHNQFESLRVRFSGIIWFARGSC